jgi:hypothetical protein
MSQMLSSLDEDVNTTVNVISFAELRHIFHWRLDTDVTKILLVLLGCALGTGCRYWLSTFVYSVVEKPSFPHANFIINVSGSFIIGILAELFEVRALISPAVRLVLKAREMGPAGGRQCCEG